jgi:sporulation protein YlmC with PRC-barrel domain
VVNRRDENLGEIHELVIDVKDGRLVYVVLSIGDTMGMVNKLVCLALESLRITRH